MFESGSAFNIQKWLEMSLANLPRGSRILDAGAGELKNKALCGHLDYVSQDFCQYEGTSNMSHADHGLQSDSWDTSAIDIVSDISSIPEPDRSFDAIMCSEVLEHVPDPVAVIKEFSRLLKSGGKLLITAPFASFVHIAPYHFNSGFSRYWYEHHLSQHNFKIIELTPNGDWFTFLNQEITRLGYMERRVGNWRWPFSYGVMKLLQLYFKIRGNKRDSEFACLGWFCLAEKNS